jgi:putative Mg2+ transporter-C (MgtC) family protein
MQHPWDILAQVGIACLLGAVIGFDRELRGKPAGLRTHMLVAAASALLIRLGPLTVALYVASCPGADIRTDPLRIIESVITGVAVLGAGTIFFRPRGESVKGLTTAASLLFVCGIGMAVALGEYLLATGLTALTLVVVELLGVLERALKRKRKEQKNPTDPAG